MVSESASNGWRAIRPWTPPLSLTTREVTSVSVTFILSSHLSDPNDDLGTALGFIMADEATYDTNHDDESSSSTALENKKNSIISDALAKGLSVNVNGSPWQRVFIRIDEGADEAVIIIYGLMPGRQYDVDMGLVQGDSSNKIRRQIITEDATLDVEPPEEGTDLDSSFSHSTSSPDPAPSTPSTSPNRTHPNTPPSSDISPTVEERLSQLEHTLSVLNVERDTLSASLKSSRRDAQKADASLRSEIEILKRASEKHISVEQKAKQRILSLQEALKRAQFTARETEDLAKEVEQVVPNLKMRQDEKENEYSKVKEEADKVRKEKDRVLEKEKKKIEGMKAELAALTNKAEKLSAKKEKLETSIIPDLEVQLKETELEIEKVEKECSHALLASEWQELSVEDPTLLGPDSRSPAYSYLPAQRVPPQLSPGVIGRPGPIQRPQPSDPVTPPFTQQSSPWNLGTPRQQAPHSHHTSSQSYSHLSHTHHNPRSSSLQFNPTTILTNPLRHPPFKQNGTPHPPPATPSSTTGLVSSTMPIPSPTTSTLSSRAPPFEPSWPVKTSSSSSSTSSSSVQRPPPGLGGSSNFRSLTQSGTGGSLKSHNINAAVNATTRTTAVRSHLPWTGGRNAVVIQGNEGRESNESS